MNRPSSAADTTKAVADDLYLGVSRTTAPVSTSQVGSDFNVVATRDTFRAVAADWPRGESNLGFFRPKESPVDPDAIVDYTTAPSLTPPPIGTPTVEGNHWISPGAKRRVRIELQPSVDNPDSPGALDQTVSITVTDPRLVTFASAGFVNYPTQTQTPIGSVREFEVRVNFSGVSSNDAADQDEPAIGPTVGAQENFKLAEANVHIVSNFGGQNQFSVNTPTSLGFVGIFSDVTVNVNTLNIIVTPLGGIGVRPIAATEPSRLEGLSGAPDDDTYVSPTYKYHDRVFGPSFELELSENPVRIVTYDPGPALPDAISQGAREPADEFVFNSIEQTENPILFVDPLLFSIDPINSTGSDPLGIVLGASQIFRTMVQFTENQAPVERTLDYVPTLVPHNADPALAGFGDAATGRLAVSAINDTAVGNVDAADVVTSTGYVDLASHPDVAAVLNTVRGIVISLDAAGRPINKKGSWTSVTDSLGQTGPAQSVTKVDAVTP